MHWFIVRVSARASGITATTTSATAIRYLIVSVSLRRKPNLLLYESASVEKARSIGRAVRSSDVSRDHVLRRARRAAVVLHGRSRGRSAGLRDGVRGVRRDVHELALPVVRRRRKADRAGARRARRSDRYLECAGPVVLGYGRRRAESRADRRRRAGQRHVGEAEVSHPRVGRAGPDDNAALDVHRLPAGASRSRGVELESRPERRGPVLQRRSYDLRAAALRPAVAPSTIVDGADLLPGRQVARRRDRVVDPDEI